MNAMKRAEEKTMKKVTVPQLDAFDFSVNQSFDALCVKLGLVREGVKKILVTGCKPVKDQAEIVMNLARAFSSMGKTAVFVDANLRGSTNDRLRLNYERQEFAGISDYLEGRAEADEVIYTTDIEGTFVVPSASGAANPLALLNSPRFSQLLEHLSGKFDVVLVDAPAIDAAIDATEIARSCDGAVLVIAYDTVKKEKLCETKLLIERAGCPVLGTVLTGAPANAYFNR